MIDNPKFDPILDYLAENKIPLIGHFGEPRNCWLPIEEMTVNDYKDYYRENPQFHMYLPPGFTNYEDQVEARDHMLEKHPKLIFIGAHLGSLEWSVDELAKRLDKFPNMAVDMAERISHLQYQSISNWQKIHDFMIKYQDRLLYATDIIVDGSKSPSEMKDHAHRIRLSHWQFFTSNKSMNVPSSVDGEFKGLKLPREVIDKVYAGNAEKWIPGLFK
jgi:predicted TIM-barrel fold metal-dependent hydrolase